MVFWCFGMRPPVIASAEVLYVVMILSPLGLVTLLSAPLKMLALLHSFVVLDEELIQVQNNAIKEEFKGSAKQC